MLNWSFFIFFVTDDASSNLHLSFNMSLNLKHFAVLKFFLQLEACALILYVTVPHCYLCQND